MPNHTDWIRAHRNVFDEATGEASAERRQRRLRARGRTADRPAPHEPSAFDKKYAYDGDDLGVTYKAEKSTFKLWAPTATNFFASPMLFQ